ncbi:hypothetical protein EGH21_22310 [Halomicroarcula sp. F13]|uniref:C2H2-type domain-containing protein n=1 Tax=Haloarcula rubra TaxID=2487747 RepID=A0AAW4Q0E9_9EURY|nr:hypothetical protein [Halomicroarcula rubra]MBX0325754.1 hypothetical protein [Halomicroarcula rubra]
MTLVLPCSNCKRPFRACDLSHIEIEPPHYEDLPEPSAENYVDIKSEDRPDERVIRLHYCEMCLDDVELPPLEPVSDPEVAPRVHHPGTTHDDGGQHE